MHPETYSLISILLIEDNPGDIELTQDAFEDCHVRNALYIVNDGIEALQFLRREGNFKDAARPDVILLDLNLPRMDGKEFLQILKKDAGLREIPVVILSGSECEADMIRKDNLRPNHFLTKPINLKCFLEITKLLEIFWFGIFKLPQEA